MTSTGAPSPNEGAGDLTPRGRWTQERLELRAWLAQTASPLEPLYAGAVAIVDDVAVPGRSYFVWHAIREIRSALPRLINGDRVAPFSYSRAMKPIARRWRDEGLPVAAPGWDLASPTEPDPTGRTATHAMSSDLATAIAQLVDGHEGIRTKQITEIQRALASVLGTDVPAYAITRWRDRFEEAHNNAHVQESPHTQEFIDGLAEEFGEFEAFLILVNQRSYVTMDSLDEILANANRG